MGNYENNFAPDRPLRLERRQTAFWRLACPTVCMASQRHVRRNEEKGRRFQPKHLKIRKSMTNMLQKYRQPILGQRQIGVDI